MDLLPGLTLHDPLDAAWPTTMRLLGGLALVLLLASSVGLVLKHAVARGQPHATIDNLNQRINAWWVMVAALGAAFALGPSGVVLLFALASACALCEFTGLLRLRPADRAPLAAALLLVLPLQYLAVWAGRADLFAALLPLAVTLLLPALALLSGDTRYYLARSAKLQWGVLLCVVCVSHVPALARLQIPGFEGRSLQLVAFLVIVVQGSDVLQYICGKLFGRRLLAPALSPSKTWAGLLGGLAGAAVLGAALHGITPFSPLAAAALALLAAACGALGALVLSAVKRDRGVKDWGRLIEGHGGVLDRLDSLVFSAPVFFHVLRVGWAG